MQKKKSFKSITTHYDLKKLKALVLKENKNFKIYFYIFNLQKSSLEKRLFLRKKLLKVLSADFVLPKNFNKQNILNLNFPPLIKGVNLSISHTKNYGAFVIQKKGFIGVDIEERLRVKKDAVQRICKTKKELLLAPHPSALWCAKEAVFKALNNAKTKEVVKIKNIFIKNWTKKADNIYTYDFVLKSQKGKGFVIVFKTLTLSLAFL